MGENERYYRYVFDLVVYTYNLLLTPSMSLSLSPLPSSSSRQMLVYGKRMTPWEIDGLIESVTAKDVMRVAQHYIWDRDVALVGYGPVDGLQDYTRVRAAMSPSYF